MTQSISLACNEGIALSAIYMCIQKWVVKSVFDE